MVIFLKVWNHKIIIDSIQELSSTSAVGPDGVPFEGVLVEAYKGTRRKHNLKFRQIGHTTSQYGQSFFPKTISAWNGLAFAEAPSLAVFRSHFIKN